MVEETISYYCMSTWRRPTKRIQTTKSIQIIQQECLGRGYPDNTFDNDFPVHYNTILNTDIRLGT